MEKSTSEFIKSLYSILSNKSLSPILHWCREGSAFTILNIIEFESTILSNYFPELTLKQFKSRLKTLSFTRTKLNSSLEFFHDYFNGKKPQLLRKISAAKPKPSRKKNNFKAEFLQKLTVMESVQSRMEESAQDLEKKFSKMIELNKFILEELCKPNFSLKYNASVLIERFN